MVGFVSEGENAGGGGMNLAGRPGRNTGHGHVYERPDGVKARCGGPPICAHCSKDQLALWAQENNMSPKSKVMFTVDRHEELVILAIAKPGKKPKAYYFSPGQAAKLSEELRKVSKK